MAHLKRSYMTELHNNSPSDELKRKGIVTFRLKPDEYALVERYVVPAFHQNGNIKNPTVGALAKHLLIASSNKYIKYLEQSYNERMVKEAQQGQQSQQQQPNHPQR